MWSECCCVPGQNDPAPWTGVIGGPPGPSSGCHGREVPVGGLQAGGEKPLQL